MFNRMRRDLTQCSSTRRRRRRGEARTPLLLAVCFLLGIAASAFLFSLRDRAQHKTPAAAPSALTEGSRAVLGRIESPVEIRFYALLDPASASDQDRAFAGRVERLLAEYERQGEGRISLKRVVAQPDASNSSAAAADGIRPFNLDKGECYLGIALALKGQKETLSELSPQWEPALESDLARAIDRLVSAARPAMVAAAAAARTDTNAVQEVKALIPNLSEVSAGDGAVIVRASAMGELQAVAADLESRLKEAEQQLAEAKNGRSEADQKAALQHLQDIQAEQMDKVKAIAAKAQAQIQALQQMKSSSR